MAKKLTKILTLGVMIVMGLGIFAGCGSNNGKVVINKPFYSLQAAKNEGFVTKNDLKTIADLHKNGNADVLGNEIANEIKAAYFEKNHRYEMTADDVVIRKYLGTYNGAVAVMIDYIDSEYPAVSSSETVGGIKFEYSNGGLQIIIWKK